MLRKVSLVVFKTVLYNFITWMNINGTLRGRGTCVDYMCSPVWCFGGFLYEEGSLCGFNLKGDLSL